MQFRNDSLENLQFRTTVLNTLNFGTTDLIILCNFVTTALNTSAARGAPRHDQRRLGWGLRGVNTYPACIYMYYCFSEPPEGVLDLVTNRQGAI